MNTSTVYEIKTTKAFDRSFKRLMPKDVARVMNAIYTLAAGKTLPERYNNHILKEYKQKLFDCHIRGDLILLYEIDDDALVLTAVDVGSHSSIF